jgi:hypothetical protein
MPRECTICRHPDAVLINEALVVERRSLRNIAKQFDVSYSAVNRHKEHIPQLLVKAWEAEQAAQADSLLDRVEALHEETKAVLEEVKGTDLYGPRLAAIREMRSNLELIGEITKELNRQPSFNLVTNPEYLQLRDAIIMAVEPYPEVAQAIGRAMLEIEGNGTGS